MPFTSLHTLATVSSIPDTLTVGDMPEFAARGGVIQFVSHGNKVRCEVNLTAADQARVSPSSDLLRVATAVRQSTRPGA